MPLVNLTTPDAIGDVEQCVVITWLKREGDEVEIGETILELQAAKVAFDVPSPVTGHLVDILAKQGDVVNWGQVLAHLEVSEVAFVETIRTIHLKHLSIAIMSLLLPWQFVLQPIKA